MSAAPDSDAGASTEAGVNANADAALSTAARQARDAHVAWLMQHTDGEALQQWMSTSLDTLLEYAQQLSLDDVVTREQVAATALRFAAELPLTGGIPELVSQVARDLHEGADYGETSLGDLLPGPAVQHLLEKGMELRPLAETMLAQLQDSAAFRELFAALLHQALRNLITDSGAARRLPSALTRRAPARLSDAFDQALARSAQLGAAGLGDGIRQLLAATDDDTLSEAATQCWEALEALPLTPVREGLGGDDIDDIVALAFSFWQAQRDQPLYRQAIERGVEAVFTHYADVSLRAVLADLGIDRAMLHDEARRYAPSVFAALRERGILAELLRDQLTPFYASDAFAAAIATNTDAPQI